MSGDEKMVTLNAEDARLAWSWARTGVDAPLEMLTRRRDCQDTTYVTEALERVFTALAVAGVAGLPALFGDQGDDLGDKPLGGN